MALCIHPHRTGEGWIYRGIMYSPPYNWRGGGYIVALCIHPHTTGEAVAVSWHYVFTPIQLHMGWIYRGIMYSPHTTIDGVSMLWHYGFNPYVALYIHSHTIRHGGGNILGHYIFITIHEESGSRYIVALYIHSHTTRKWGWLQWDILSSFQNRSLLHFRQLLFLYFLLIKRITHICHYYY